jgi:hypothetical protein
MVARGTGAGSVRGDIAWLVLSEKNSIDSRLGARPSHVRAKLAAAAGVILPAILFYGILSRFVPNLPMFDDYDSILGFCNHVVQLHGVGAKSAYFQAAQHLEYKVFFLEAVTWLQVSLIGHVNLHALSWIGNSFVLALAVVLWKMFLPREKDLTVRLALFIPASWLLFQLQYWQTLDWATASLQNLPVLVFSLGTIYLLLRPAGWSFCGAVVCLVLAISSSGNGLLLIPIGLAILLRRRIFVRAIVWLVVSAGCLAAYFCNYQPIGGGGYSILAIPLHLRPVYILSFIGGAVGHPFAAGALLLGFILCAFFGWLAWRGYFRGNALAGYCIIFLLLTAVGVAGIRSSSMGSAAMTSRYTIYSALLLIFAWLAIVEAFLQKQSGPLWRNCIFLCAVTATVLFSIAMDVHGLHNLTTRRRLVEQGVALYEKPQPGAPVSGPYYIGDEQSRRAPFSLHARDVLIESEELGTYRLPPASGH